MKQIALFAAGSALGAAAVLAAAGCEARVRIESEPAGGPEAHAAVHALDARLAELEARVGALEFVPPLIEGTPGGTVPSAVGPPEGEGVVRYSTMDRRPSEGGGE